MYLLSINAENPPLSQHSIQNSPETKSHSYAHNSVTAPIMRQINPRYTFLHIYFGSNQYFSTVKIVLPDLPQSGLLAKILSEHNNYDICITSITHFDLLCFAP